MATRLQLLRVLPALLGLGYSLPTAAATTVPEQLIGWLVKGATAVGLAHDGH